MAPWRSVCRSVGLPNEKSNLTGGWLASRSQDKDHRKRLFFSCRFRFRLQKGRYQTLRRCCCCGRLCVCVRRFLVALFGFTVAEIWRIICMPTTMRSIRSAGNNWMFVYWDAVDGEWLGRCFPEMDSIRLVLFFRKFYVVVKFYIF